jgi:hypothetical protein
VCFQPIGRGKHVCCQESDSFASREMEREYTQSQVLEEWIVAVEQAIGCSLDIRPGDPALLDPCAFRKVAHHRLVEAGVFPSESDPYLLTGPIRTFGAALRARYRPANIYDGSVLLVLANDSRLNASANQKRYDRCIRGWSRWAPNLKYRLATGNHASLLKIPNISSWIPDFSQLI